MQQILVGVIVLGAVFYLVRLLVKRTKRNSCDTGDCGCDASTSKNKV
jgi:hypothetical protein